MLSVFLSVIRLMFSLHLFEVRVKRIVCTVCLFFPPPPPLQKQSPKILRIFFFLSVVISQVRIKSVLSLLYLLLNWLVYNIVSVTKCCGRQHGFSSIVGAAADGQPVPQHMERVSSSGDAGREREKDSRRRICRGITRWRGVQFVSCFWKVAKGSQAFRSLKYIVSGPIERVERASTGVFLKGLEVPQ